MWYGDGSLVYGLLAKETFAFNTSDGQQMQVSEVTFGCTDVSNGTFDKHTTGIIGLGRGPLSLVSQLGPLFGYKFSYCLAPQTTNSTSGKINFGANALFSSPDVQSTPLIRTPLLPSTFFIVHLSGIKVGDLKLETQDSNIVLDSGTTLTYLDQKLVRPIQAKVKKMINLQTVEDTNFDLCFKTGLTSSKIEYPDIILMLGTVNIKLGPEKAFFHWEDGKVCLNIISSPTGFQILGNIAQQDLHVGYDLQQERVYFALTNCTRL
jgi:Xylanase inhibitor N-terminal/Xylanase inhibitor C-terminal